MRLAGDSTGHLSHGRFTQSNIQAAKGAPGIDLSMLSLQVSSKHDRSSLGTHGSKGMHAGSNFQEAAFDLVTASDTYPFVLQKHSSSRHLSCLAYVAWALIVL